MTTETIFKTIRKAIDLGFLPKTYSQDEYARNVERIQELILYADLVRGEETK